MKSIPAIFTIFLLCSIAITSTGQQMPQDDWVFDGQTIKGEFGCLSIGSNGRIYAVTNYDVGTDTYDAVIIMNLDGNAVGSFGNFPPGVQGIGLDSQNNVYVYKPGDQAGKIIEVFDEDGTDLLRPWGSRGTNIGEFMPPQSGTLQSALGIDSQDRIIVADSGNWRIQIFDTNGSFLSAFGEQGSLIGQFSEQPRSLAIGRNDDIYVHGGGLHRFDSSGRILATRAVVNNFGLPVVSPDGLLIQVPKGGLQLSISNPDFSSLFELTLPRLPKGPGGASPDERSNNDLTFDSGGNIYVSKTSGADLLVYERRIRTDNPVAPNAIPHASILSVIQRPLTTYVDIDFSVLDADDTNVMVGILGFVDGGTSLNNAVQMTSYIEHSETNLGTVLVGTQYRVTWDAAADWAADFGEIQFQIMARDKRELLGFHFISLPSSGGELDLAISRKPVTDAELLNLWYWLIATNNPDIDFIDGSIRRSSDNELMASGGTTTPSGRAYLYQMLQVREVESAELTRAQQGNYGFISLSSQSVVNLR